ncbi:hypothetical protein KIL84_008780 [Mauremys mutica]|uniref:Uncharacterized protein n=1 Tax=Mauremys mutica TaxID=74926 RepID=A0A9D3X3J1_9SAUR|nr:hypothetical protein KIL84_008780 [Mauremys mutica]
MHRENCWTVCLCGQPESYRHSWRGRRGNRALLPGTPSSFSGTAQSFELGIKGGASRKNSPAQPSPGSFQSCSSPLSKLSPTLKGPRRFSACAGGGFFRIKLGLPM